MNPFLKKTLQVSLLLSLSLAPNLHLSSHVPTAQALTATSCTTPFTDIKGHWAETAICTLYKKGAISGVSKKNFEPDIFITRAEFLKITLEALNYSVYPVQSATFTDTEAGAWYYRYVTFAHSKGFVQGYADGSFHPDASITRAEALSILIDIAGYSNTDTSKANVHFSDVNSNDWFAVAVSIGAKDKLIQGYGDGSFRPNNSISRAEACTVIVRAMQKI